MQVRKARPHQGGPALALLFLQTIAWVSCCAVVRLSYTLLHLGSISLPHGADPMALDGDRAQNSYRLASRICSYRRYLILTFHQQINGHAQTLVRNSAYQQSVHGLTTSSIQCSLHSPHRSSQHQRKPRRDMLLSLPLHHLGLRLLRLSPTAFNANP